jgi:hypothetical protein
MLPAKSVPPYVVKATLRMGEIATEDPTNPDAKFSWVDGGIDEEGRPVLNLEGESWWRLLTEFEVRVDAATVKAVLPAKGSLADDTTMYLTIQCPTTKVRRSIEMTPDEKTPRLWRIDLDLERRDVRSRVVLRPMLCRKTDILGGGRKDVARRKHSLLAFGEPIVLRIDEFSRGVHSLVEFKSANFKASKNEALNSHPKNLYSLEISNSGPIVWVNSGHRRFHGVFHEQGSSGYGPALRDVTRLWIGESVWNQLFHAALGSLDTPDQEEDPPLPTDWRGPCLTLFLERMFPEESTGQERLRRAIEMRQSQDSSGVLVSMVSAVAQEVVKARELFDSAVRLAETAAQQEEA